MQKIEERHATQAIKCIIGNKENYGAISTLIAHSTDPTHVTEKTIALLLGKWQLSCASSRHFPDMSPIIFAMRLLPDNAPFQTLASRVVTEIARLGIYGSFPALTRRVLGRDPSAHEIGLLVSNYVNDKTSSSSHVEQILSEMARKYLSHEQAESEIARIGEFQMQWHMDALPI